MNLTKQNDPDFHRLWSDPNQFRENYEYDMGFFKKRVMLTHTFVSLMHVRQRLKQIDEKSYQNHQEPLHLQYTDIPNIKYEDEAISNSQKGIQILKQILEQDNQKNLNSGTIFKLLWEQHRPSILFIFFLFFFELVCRLGFSILLQELFTTVSDLEPGDNKLLAYLLAVYCGAMWFIGLVTRNNTFYEMPILAARMRSQLILILYAKLTKISQYTAKSQELGKIINLLSNDFNTIEVKSPMFFALFLTPFNLVGVTAILLWRFGWPGLILLAVVVAFVPLQSLVGKMNGGIVQQINVYKDKRIKLCTEIIEGIKFIKLYGWQIAFERIIKDLRRQEIKDYFKLAITGSLERTFGIFSVSLATYACFSVMDLTGRGASLSTAKILATIELMWVLKEAILNLGISFGLYQEMKIIYGRLCTILNMDQRRMVQIDAKGIQINQKSTKNSEFLQKGEIVFRNFNGYWKTKELTTPSLHNINVQIKPRELIGVTGKVGSGKSGLLGVILEEIPYYSGYFGKRGSVAYVEQEPIIFSATIKENILFGSNYQETRYRNVIEMSCLNTDLQILEKGDQTVVGQRGITLSGGQKARLALARALYFDADIYLLDDPISAVDSKVAKKIYENVIMKMKGDKTIILVTHQISYMYGCDRVIIMEDGRVTDFDEPAKLKNRLNVMQSPEKLVNRQLKKTEKSFQNRQNLKQEQDQNVENESQIQKQELQKMKSSSTKVRQQNAQVNWKSYVNYFFHSSKNNIIFPLCIIFFILAEVINVFYFRLICQYDLIKNGSTQIKFRSMSEYWLTLGLLLLGYLVLCLVRYFLLNASVLNSNQQIHQNMIHGIVRSPCSYFDITPTGRLTNKFSNDLGLMDGMMIFALTDAIEGPIVSIISIFYIFSINLYFIGPGLINIMFVISFFIYCKQAIIAVKQLDLRLKSPMFNMVIELASSLIQIRIYGRRYNLLSEFAQVINKCCRSTNAFWILSRGFGVNVVYFSILVMWIGWMLGIYKVTPENAGAFGVSVVFLLKISDTLQRFLRQLIIFESMMVSVQRTLSLVDLPAEKQLISQYDKENQITSNNQWYQNQQTSFNQHFKAEPQRWPQKATIRFDNFSMRYREGLPLVLKNISFDIKDGEKVGIVGRTGAGKSSIIQALFRICEPESGSVYELGGCDALQMGLHSLRQNISVIPQSPFLFKGSIRKNLDPFETRGEEELWAALAGANLKEAVERLPERLLTDVTNIAEVFSVGQKQLLCLARALLRRNKVLVLDQATANVDMITDNFIQRCIQTHFANTTVVTIAHRLNTIADYDKVIVIDKGRIVECGSPFDLLIKKGMFSEMVEHTGINAEIIKRIAKQSYDSKMSF